VFAAMRSGYQHFVLIHNDWQHKSPTISRKLLGYQQQK
jgi:hypothetical protein